MGDVLKVMQFDGKSYVQLVPYNYSTNEREIRTSYRINGKEPVIGHGDNRWAFVEGEIASIERKRTGPEKTLRWERDEGAPEHLPATLPAESITYVSGEGMRCTEGYDASFYSPVRVPGEVIWEPVEFEVIDRNCKPVAMEPWAKVNWPANVERYKEQQHKYPCYIDVKDLFALVAEAVRAKINESNGALTWDQYLNIGTFTVKRVVQIPAEMQKPERREVIRIGSRSRRPKYETITRRVEHRELFTYNGFYEGGSSHTNTILGKSIQGANYEDLLAKVTAHVDEIAAMCDTDQWCICPKCNGRGVTITKAKAEATTHGG
jgi:hypothetical protein